ncbi:hypothetical protein DPMN_024885 [Dreissena polymorpha]|uniref:Uncharacterized protein n=1 Tax=Dreissena polymorpha TaxID=45954 RepID=A0A9D4RB62_DREPO|nr:hypothetical protein DPMN_024885 [Dreissena polymorpha]
MIRQIMKPPPWRPYIYKTNLFNKFHDDWAKNVTFRVHVMQLTGTILELNSHIKETNVLTKFHENWAKNVTSRVFICFHYIHIEKNAPPTGGHVFSPIWTIFELVQDINKTNILTNFHDDWAKIVTSRVFTRKTALPTGGNFEIDRDIIGTKLLTKFMKIGKEMKTARPPGNHKNAPRTGGHISIKPIFKTNVHDDWEKIVTSRVFTRKTAPPTGGHVFQWTGTTFELN